MSEEITISVQTAEQLLSLFANIASADAHFKNCQAVLFRQHMQSVYTASNVSTAFYELKAAIEAAKGEKLWP